jgi:hypothetical protein
MEPVYEMPPRFLQTRFNSLFCLGNFSARSLKSLPPVRQNLREKGHFRDFPVLFRVRREF